jgi:hypothetical protein
VNLRGLVPYGLAACGAAEQHHAACVGVAW